MVLTLYSAAIWFNDNQGLWPVNISIKVHPRLQISTFALYGSFLTTSGAIQYTDPRSDILEFWSYTSS